MGSYCCKTVQWISQLHDALPPKWQPRTFADANCLTRRIAVLEKVMEYIIHLTNQHNALGGPPLTWTTLPLTTQSVFEVYPDRKEQHAQVVSRLKALLGLVHVKKISDTFELAYVRIGELQRELGSLTPSDADNGSLCVRDIKSALHATGTPATKRLLDIGSSSDRAPTRRAHRVLKPQPDSTRKRHAVQAATGSKNPTHHHGKRNTFGEILREQEQCIRKSTGLKVVSPSIRDRGDVSLSAAGGLGPAAKCGGSGGLPLEIYAQIARLAIEIREFEDSEHLRRG